MPDEIYQDVVPDRERENSLIDEIRKVDLQPNSTYVIKTSTSKPFPSSGLRRLSQLYYKDNIKFIISEDGMEFEKVLDVPLNKVNDLELLTNLIYEELKPYPICQTDQMVSITISSRKFNKIKDLLIKLKGM